MSRKSGYDNKIIVNNRIVYKYSADMINKYKLLSNKIKFFWSIRSKDRYKVITDIVETISNGNIVIDSKNTYREVNNNEFTIIRGDISHFFDSVDKSKLYRIIFSNGTFSNSEEKLLKEIFFDRTITGIPQGNPISSILSEIYLKNFDQYMTLNYKYLLYERFVDDFVLILPYSVKNDELIIIKNQIKSFLNGINLKISEKKFYMVTDNDLKLNSGSFNFLGYNISIKNIEDKYYVCLKISTSKIKKYKDRIYKAFYEYNSTEKETEDFVRLKIKIENILVGVITVDKYGKKERLGIPFGYSLINDKDNIKDIYNLFMHLCYKSNLKKDEFKLLIKIAKNFKRMLDENYIYIINYLKMPIKDLKNICHDMNVKNISNKTKTEIIQRLFKKVYRK
ncbi:reverse transcriptase domain-containing protein [Lentilactobacillus senioris]|nr:reverse transcriptase domain-containing protein [Lentilactobacillus senioris]